LKNSYIELVEIDSELIKEIERNFSNFISYKEGNLVNFVDKYMKYHKGTTKGKKAQGIKKTDSVFSETNIDDFNSIYSSSNTDVGKIKKVQEINSSIRNSSNIDRINLERELDKLSQEVIEYCKARCKELFIYQKTKSMIEIIKGTVNKKTQKVSKPTDIGFAELIAKRARYMEDNNNLKKSLADIQYSKNNKLGFLPNKGEVILETKIIVLSTEDRHKKDSVFDKNKIKKNRDLITKIYNFKTSDFSSINEYFDVREKGTSAQDFSNDIIKKESKITIKNESDYHPSEGEKAILSISGVLENYNYDCYLFDEVERGLGHKYISDYLLPQLDKLRNKGKTIVLSTHNAKIRKMLPINPIN
jgi:hypothetical protein